MSFAKHATDSFDLSQAEEVKYQIAELKYHLQCLQESIQEANYHLKKSLYHESLIEDVNNKFKGIYHV